MESSFIMLLKIFLYDSVVKMQNEFGTIRDLSGGTFCAGLHIIGIDFSLKEERVLTLNTTIVYLQQHQGASNLSTKEDNTGLSAFILLTTDSFLPRWPDYIMEEQRTYGLL